MPMKLKTIELEDGKIVAEVKDGQPVYIDDGKEVPFDAVHALSKISELNGEAQRFREAKEKAESDLSKFKSIEDPEAALAAIEKVKALGDKELIDAGKVEELKAAAIKAAEEGKAAAIAAKDDEIAKVKGERDTLSTQLSGALIGGSFDRSKWVKENIAIPADMLQSRFGSNFKVEDGKVAAYDSEGQKLYSRSKPGELAGFDEALEILVDKYPYKDNILKGRGHEGAGSNPPAEGGPKGKTMNRAEFDKLPHADRAAKIKDGYKIVDAA